MAAMNKGSIYQDAPDRLIAAMTTITALRVKASGRGENDPLIIDLKQAEADIKHGLGFINQLAYIFDENKTLRHQIAWERKRVEQLESELILYNAIEQFMIDGTLDEKIQIVKSKINLT